MPPAVSAKEFLTAIWGDTKGVAELTAIGSQFTNAYPFDYPDGLDTLVDAAPRHNKSANIYVGICLRRERWPRLTGLIDPLTKKPEVAKRGTEDNALSSWCVWCEFDFTGLGHKGKTCSPELAKKMLKDFPLHPSIVVKSGGGIQAYWLLKEPAMGDDLWRAKSINIALVRYFTQGDQGADPSSVDLARIFRLPGTMNIKYTPPRLCEISWWDPDRRYVLDDFDMLPQEQMLRPAAAPLGTSLSIGAPAPAAAAPGAAPGATGGPRPEPSIELNQDMIDELGRAFGEIWFEGARHQMALTVAGMLAYHNVKYESAVAIITIASELADGDTSKRLKDVHDTYKGFIQGKEIQGAPALDKLIDSTFPVKFRESSKKAVNAIKRKLPSPWRPPGEGDDEGGKKFVEPDFDVPKIIKFNSIPQPLYTVIVRKHGDDKDYDVRCDLETFGNIAKFRLAFLAATENKTLAPIKQWQWEAIFSRAPLEIHAAPQEASISGHVRTTLEEFLEQKKENPEPGDLKTFAGYNDTDYFFSLAAFTGRLKDRGIKATTREVTQVLKEDGWKDDRFWVGSKNPRLWIKRISQNGNGHAGGGNNGDGDGSGKPPKDPAGVPATVVQTFGGNPVPAVVVQNEEPKDMFGALKEPSKAPKPVKSTSTDDEPGDSEPPFQSEEPVDVGFDEEDLPDEGDFQPPGDES